MSKFKVGDKVRVLDYAMDTTPNKSYELTYAGLGTVEFMDDVGDERTRNADTVELISKGAIMGRRTFRQLKESDVFKKGALWQEACDDGDQDYEVLNESEYRKQAEPKSLKRTIRSRDSIENNPAWFEEVFPATQEYLTKEELDAFKDFVKQSSKKVKKEKK